MSSVQNLKERWRILKSGIRLYNTEPADNVWLRCCAVHNMLLDVDGLSKSWNNGVRSRWQLESGKFGLVDPTGTEEFRLRQYDRFRFEYQRPLSRMTTAEMKVKTMMMAIAATVANVVATEITRMRPYHVECNEDKLNRVWR